MPFAHSSNLHQSIIGQSKDRITRPDTANGLQDTSSNVSNRSNASVSCRQSVEMKVVVERAVASRMSENSIVIKETEDINQISRQVKLRETMPKSCLSKFAKFVTIKMELNFTLPKGSKRDCSFGLPTKLTLAILMLAAALLNCTLGHQIEEPNSVNEINQRPQTNFSHLTRDVTNLRMTSDWRSIKLRWNYVQPSGSQIAPAAFEIRYCELTSWLAEIKCRHKDVPVDRPKAIKCNTANSTVIADCRRPPEGNVVHQLASGELIESGLGQKSTPLISSLFETHIFDLRALTNYTFDVQVARFVGEPAAPIVGNSLASGKFANSMARTRPRPARRLEFAVANNENKLQRIETKPFQAEALKCLANSSEVLINTGRYFGGRISVEGQPFDARCQLIGNRTSDQTSYLFRIDHDLCRSKKIDSNRIETIILVHENKDILTHNTARFLVQCNIMQKSFTVKASVSLPKINGLNQQQQQQQPSVSFRPATITALAGKPSRELRDEQQVRLGSMPGVYRLIRVGNVGDQEEVGARIGQLATATNAADIDAPAFVSAQKGDRQQVASRRSKELLAHEVPARDNGSKGDNYQFELPKPVEVSSKILFVARTNNGLELPKAAVEPVEVVATRHRNAQLDSIAFNSTVSLNGSETAPRSLSLEETKNVLARSLAAPTQADFPAEKSIDKTPPMQMGANFERSMRTAPTLDEGDSSMKSAVIMTNNHRVAGHFPALAQLTTASLNQPTASKTMRASELTSAINEADYSIKYSPADVSEYSLDSTPTNTMATTHKPGRDNPLQHVAPTGPMMTTSSGPIRSRSGRMRHIVSSPAPSGHLMGYSHKAEGRMGDILPPLDLMGAESAVHKEVGSILSPDGASTAIPQINATSTGLTVGQTHSPTLAQNITGALIRWSLKALGNLARKSLESLDERDLLLNGDNQTTGPNGELINLRDGFLVDGGQLVKSSMQQPAHHQTDWPSSTTTTTTTTTSGPRQPAKAATQSADLIQSRGSHHLLPPPVPTSLVPKQRQTTTMALTTTTTPSAPQATPSGARGTMFASAVTQQQRTQKSHSFTGQKHHDNHEDHFHDEQQAKSVLQSPNQLLGTASQVKQVAGSLSPLWPVYVFWALIGLGVLCMFVVYFVAIAPTNIFKPTNQHARPYPSTTATVTTTTTSTSQPPRMGLLSQLNDAIYRHQLATPRSECTFGAPQMGSPQSTGASVNTISRLLPHADVRSPRQQRRHLNELSKQQRQDGNLPPAPPNLASSSSSELSSGAATRSTSAASTANMSTMRTDENYCKNHEQFVYTDYLLLNSSDCLANDCGRESFA